MKFLLLIVIICPIALFYVLPKYIKLRERFIELEKNSVSLKKYKALQHELEAIKKRLADTEQDPAK